MNAEIVLNFVKSINEHNVSKLIELVSDDHTFADAHNNIISGREIIRKGWQGYFSLFPDYRIEVEEFYESDNTFVMLGFASGTYKGIMPELNHWKLPAAWKAVTGDGKVTYWQVYCDTRIPAEIIEKC